MTSIGTMAKSVQLLQRFYARESARLASAAAKAAPITAQPDTSPSSSTTATTRSEPSPSTSGAVDTLDAFAPPAIQWTKANNPFLRQRAASTSGRTKSLRPLYSLRRQQQLLRALQVVQSGGAPYTVASLAQQNLSQPSAWTLPEGPKTRLPGSSAPAKPLRPKAAAQTEAEESSVQLLDRATTASAWAQARLRKGNKGHKWERQKETLRLQREEKLRSMPARIAEYQKARGSAKAALKPGLPF